jgi:hypothetical protein
MDFQPSARYPRHHRCPDCSGWSRCAAPECDATGSLSSRSACLGIGESIAEMFVRLPWRACKSGWISDLAYGCWTLDRERVAEDRQGPTSGPATAAPGTTAQSDRVSCGICAAMFDLSDSTDVCFVWLAAETACRSSASVGRTAHRTGPRTPPTVSRYRRRRCVQPARTISYCRARSLIG